MNKVCVYFLALFTVLLPSYGFSSQRVGLSLGGGLGYGGAFTYDANPVFAPEWSLGGELYGVAGINEDKTYFALAVRSYYWENPTALTGFYGGPKLALVTVSNGGLGAAIGGEGGWSHRFGSQIDLGASLDVYVGGWVSGSLRLNVGFLIP